MLAAVHIFAGRLRFLRNIPRSRWLSLAGGGSVGYVFVHLLPELGEQQERVGERVEAAGGVLGGTLGFFEHHVYLVALLGFVTFYGLERWARLSREREAGRGGEADAGRTDVQHEPGEPPMPPRVFWVHVSSFTLYNALVGYLLLHREGEERGGAVAWESLVLFTLAMGLHFLVNDFGLRDHYQHRYQRYGRWLLSGAVLAGWAVGAMTPLHPLVIAVLVAFLAGGVVLNVVKEELPEERESRWWAFALGAAGYAGLLLVLAGV